MRHDKKYVLPQELREADKKFASSPKNRSEAVLRLFESRPIIRLGDILKATGSDKKVVQRLFELGRIVRVGFAQYALPGAAPSAPIEKTSKQRVLEYIRANPGCEPKAICNLIGKKATYEIYELVKSGLIRTEPRRYYPCAK